MMKKAQDFMAVPAPPELQSFFAACIRLTAPEAPSSLGEVPAELLDILRGMAEHIQKLEARVKFLEAKS